MLPSPSEIKYFVEVANAKNLSRAAERLGIRQPTLSLSIKKLENSLGVDLLIRTKTGVKLTKFGHEFLVGAKNILEDWEKLKGHALKQNEEVGGRYTIGVHPSVALYTLRFFLPKLLNNYPNLEINLNHGLSREMTEEVISFRVDFGIVVNPVSHPDLVITNLCKDEVTFWTSPSNKNKDVLIYDPNLLQSQDLLKKLKIKFLRTIHSSNLEVIRDLTISGAGVGILPARVAKTGNGKIELFKNNAPKFLDQISLVYRADAIKGSTPRVLIESIKNVFKN